MNTEIKNILQKVQDGSLSVDEALLKLKTEPFTDIGYANIDLHRSVRQGMAEVIYGAQKTPEQIRGIAETMLHKGERRILITRLSPAAAQTLETFDGFRYFPQAKLGAIGAFPAPNGIGAVLVMTGGTSDIPVAEEAAVTAEFFGNRVIRAYDVGVAGLHRLLARMEDIMTASVIVAVAGMEGALASVAAGLADCPMIAVPTSVGYGASFGGLSALLGMLNSCAGGVSVVNIDNGFGAGFAASRINHMEAKR